VGVCCVLLERGMSAKPIPAKEMAASILKMLNDVASEYPEEEREQLKAVMLGQLGMALFNGPLEEKST
jgi:hypothetical protein